MELTWVRAHAGDPGNELADHHAKLATAEGEKLEIPSHMAMILNQVVPIHHRFPSARANGGPSASVVQKFARTQRGFFGNSEKICEISRNLCDKLTRD
ncbi:hypothetical protein AVEN_164192-1 [Araneus ventricosus]|uniref:RNase H type-1 domain-containing protein n=1 Tax=Araneus ventricosus TaxID=182803 RepID=A0A4Y2JNT1_ARAVE|nr:hypothetical protein AVEN_164192-1 [Araneus ventricosus]